MGARLQDAAPPVGAGRDEATEGGQPARYSESGQKVNCNQVIYTWQIEPHYHMLATALSLQEIQIAQELTETN